MLPPFDYFTYRRVRYISYLSSSLHQANTYSTLKQNERAARFASLPSHYHSALTSTDKTLLAQPIESLVEDVQDGRLAPLDVLETYGKVAVRAHKKTNCITELLLPEAETWAQKEINLQGPLAGVPVSLKDSVQVKGFDISLGYTRLAGKPYAEDGAMARLLKDAGELSLIHRRELCSRIVWQGLYRTPRQLSP